MLLSAAEAWSSLDVVRRSSFASCCVFVAIFPTVDVSRIWGPSEQSSRRWLGFQETLSWVLFSNSNLALKGGVLYHKCFFFMGSPSMHFIKCDQWPIVVCNYFVFSRRTFSFKCYYCWLRKNSSFTRIYILLGRKCVIWSLRIFWGCGRMTAAGGSVQWDAKILGRCRCSECFVFVVSFSAHHLQ